MTRIMILLVLSLILPGANQIHGYDFPCRLGCSNFNIFSSLVLERYPPTQKKDAQITGRHKDKTNNKTERSDEQEWIKARELLPAGKDGMIS